MTDLAGELAGHDYWYHTIELPGGHRTPGLYDMPRALAHVGLPGSLSGQRCLDIGTSDGFWAFEMERRGAREVVALDLESWRELDWPPSHAAPIEDDGRPISPRFALARQALGSRVEWRAGSVYELAPEGLGRFDFVFLGSMLLHLRDPVRALSAVRSVTAGQVLINEAVSALLTALAPRYPAARLVGLRDPTWWIPNPAGLRRLAEAADFEVTEVGRPYYLRFGAGRHTADEQTLTPVSLRPLRSLPLSLLRNARERLGVPHAWLLASPRSDLP